MKSRHVVALIALLSVVGQAQTQAPSQSQPKPRSMADATYALKGPVKTFRTEVATFVWKDGQYVEGPRVLKDEAWFNRDGNRTDYHIYSQGKLVRRIVMKFEGRKNIESANYDGAGRMWWRSVSIYDEAGVLQGSRRYDGNGTLLTTISLKRNSRGQIVEAAEHDAKGVLIDHTTNKYEGLDLYIRERKTYFPNGSLKSDEVYTAPNKRTEIHYKLDGSVDYRMVRVGEEMAHYNADGSLRTATVIAQEDRLLDEMKFQNTGAATRETQLPDEIDQHGNWTRQTKWFANPKGTKPLTTTYRALTYYEN